MSCGKVVLDLEGIPITNYYSSEIDKYTIRISEDNHQGIKQLGNIKGWRNWNLPKIDLIMACSPCFDGNTLIITDTGYKKIKDIQVDDIVLTHTNSFKRVVQPMSKRSEQ